MDLNVNLAEETHMEIDKQGPRGPSLSNPDFILDGMINEFHQCFDVRITTTKTSVQALQNAPKMWPSLFILLCPAVIGQVTNQDQTSVTLILVLS